jgi:hypothetical protein
MIEAWKANLQTTALNHEDTSDRRISKKKLKKCMRKQKDTTPEGLEPSIFATGKQRLTIRPWCPEVYPEGLMERPRILKYIF